MLTKNKFISKIITSKTKASRKNKMPVSLDTVHTYSLLINKKRVNRKDSFENHVIIHDF